MKKSFKQIISVIMALALSASICIMSVLNTSAEENDYGCREAFAKFYREEFENAADNAFWNEYYAKNYYSNVETEATPDFVLVYCCNGLSFAVKSIVLGDYIVRVDAEAYPYPLGIYVYTPADGEIRTLTEAYLDDVKGVKAMVEACDIEYASVYRIGDVDKDGKLNIKDATLIQKRIASILEIDDVVIGFGFDKHSTGVCYSHSDFNRDEKVNVRDATAIQKHLAKIEI